MAHLHVTSLSLRGHVHTQKYMGVSEMGYIPSRPTLILKMMEHHSIWRYNIFSVKPRSVYVSIDPQCLIALTLVCGLKKTTCWWTNRVQHGHPWDGWPSTRKSCLIKYYYDIWYLCHLMPIDISIYDSWFMDVSFSSQYSWTYTTVNTYIYTYTIVNTYSYSYYSWTYWWTYYRYRLYLLFSRDQSLGSGGLRLGPGPKVTNAAPGSKTSEVRGFFAVGHFSWAYLLFTIFGVYIYIYIHRYVHMHIIYI